jgi:hypothetical protein
MKKVVLLATLACMATLSFAKEIVYVEKINETEGTVTVVTKGVESGSVGETKTIKMDKKKIKSVKKDDCLTYDEKSGESHKLDGTQH